MDIQINGKTVKTDEQGFLFNSEEWSEEFAEKIAERDGIQLFDEHWGLIGYFRDYFQEKHSLPTMRSLVMTLGKQHGERFHGRKAYEKHLYSLFPRDPLRELCKLAGLPMPQPDT
jgi:tRNA 2-thiouridine synthesizing protein E